MSSDNAVCANCGHSGGMHSDGEMTHCEECYNGGDCNCKHYIKSSVKNEVRE